MIKLAMLVTIWHWVHYDRTLHVDLLELASLSCVALPPWFTLAAHHIEVPADCGDQLARRSVEHAESGVVRHNMNVLAYDNMTT